MKRLMLLMIIAGLTSPAFADDEDEPSEAPEALTPPPAPPPPRPAATNVPLLAKPAADDGHKKPITQRTWFWVAVGAAAVLVGTVVLVGSGGEEYPVATFGTVRGN